ncbi:MAG: shikimate kinase [Gammaproteobacteria bacterium]|nr:shikimate kinase [Gammaproteobacteria bacterium]
MRDKKNIFIVGSFGVGKTTIGQELAKKLAMRFYDTDRIIEERLGVDLGWLFDVEGEEGFQKREKELLQELMLISGAVVSTGGSVALYQPSFDLLSQENDHHVIIYLYTSFSQQMKRVMRNRYHRPLLRVDDIQKSLLKIRQQCDPLYQEIAHMTFSTHNKPTQIVLKEILTQLET